MQNILCSNAFPQPKSRDRPGSTLQLWILAPRDLSTMAVFSAMDPRIDKKGWSGAPSAQQGLLHAILIQCPTTASSVQFCLLCCQPEPMPGSLAARRLQLTLQDPCRLPAWSGRTIHMLYRTCHVPEHAISQDRMATGEWILPAKAISFLLGDCTAVCNGA